MECKLLEINSMFGCKGCSSFGDSTNLLLLLCLAACSSLLVAAAVAGV